jgi:transcriptional regulator of acetoin/glycerol metabolism
MMAEYFMRKQNPRYTFQQEALEVLLAYRWPGNVRELHNFIERLLVMSENLTIKPKDVFDLLPEEDVNEADLTPRHVTDRRRVKDGELEEALRKAGGNKTLASEMLGINRSTLWRRIKKVNQS